MTWNYRIFKTQYDVKFLRGRDSHLEEYFTIREVYYEDDGSITGISGGDCGVHASGTTYEELSEDLHKMTIAFTKPVLTPLDIKGYTYDKEEIPYEEVQNFKEELQHKHANYSDKARSRSWGNTSYSFSPADEDSSN